MMFQHAIAHVWQITTLYIVLCVGKLTYPNVEYRNTSNYSYRAKIIVFAFVRNIRGKILINFAPVRIN